MSKIESVSLATSPPSQQSLANASCSLLNIRMPVPSKVRIDVLYFFTSPGWVSAELELKRQATACFVRKLGILLPLDIQE